MAPLGGSLEYSHSDVKLIQADRRRRWQQVHGLWTLCTWYRRPSTQNTGCPHSGMHICDVGPFVRAFHTPSAPPTSSPLLPCSGAWREPLLKCSLVLGSHSSEPRSKDGLSLRFCLAPSSTAAVFPSPYSFWLCLPHGLSSRAAEQDHRGGTSWAWVPLLPSCHLELFLLIYMKHVIFASMFQFGNGNSFIPLLANSIFMKAE